MALHRAAKVLPGHSCAAAALTDASVSARRSQCVEGLGNSRLVLTTMPLLGSTNSALPQEKLFLGLFRPWVDRDRRALCWWSFRTRREVAEFLLAERNASVQLQLPKDNPGSERGGGGTALCNADGQGREARIAARCRSQGRQRRSGPPGGAARHLGADVDAEVAGGAAGRRGVRGAAMARGGGKAGSLKDKLDGNELDLSLCGLSEVPVRELVSVRACGAGREQRADAGFGAAAR